MTSVRTLGLALAVPLLLAAPLGCPADSDPMLIEGACGDIVDACHTKDDGTPGQINDCHQIAHDEDESACSADRDMCIELCNAAPDVATGGHGETEGAETDADTEHESDDNGTTTEPGSTGAHETDQGTTTEHGTTGNGTGTGETTATTSTDEPSCAALGAGCHDVPGDVAMMCHDVGHEENEAACAKVWQMCREACGF